MKPLSIKSKITAVAAAVTVVLVLAGSAVQMYFVKVNLKELLGSQQLSLVSRVTDDLDSKIGEAHEALIAVAKVIPRDIVNDPMELEKNIANRPILRLVFDEILILAPDGRIVFDRPAAAGRRGFNSAAQEYFKATMSTRKPYISKPFRGPITGRPFIAMTAPILNDKGEIVAILNGGFNLFKPNFLGKLADAKVGKTGAFGLFTRDRLIVISRAKDRILTMGPPPGEVRYFDHAIAGLEGWEEDTSSRGVRSIYGYKPMRTLPWVLAASLPVEEAYAPIAEAQQRIVLIAAAVIILLAPILWLSMRYLFAPLLRLRETIRELSDNPGMNARVPVGTKDEVGELGAAFNALMDRQQRAEQALVDSESKFRGIAEQSLVGISLVTPDRILYGNTGFAQMFGYSSEEVLRLGLQNLVASEDVAGVQDSIRRRAAGEVTQARYAFRGVRKDGAPIDVEVHGSRVKIGDTWLAMAVMLDISDRKRADEKIRLLNDDLERRVAQRTVELETSVRELERFAYAVAHDFRSPLRAISGYANVVAGNLANAASEDDRAYLQRIAANAKHMGQLIDDLLAYSRSGREPLHKQTVDMAALVRAVVSAQVPADGVAHTTIGVLPSCEGDPAMLEQVWANLISNASKFVRPGIAPAIEIGCADGAYFVRDHGVGFDMAYADKLFGIFNRLHLNDAFEGTGVGLAVVKRIVERHGGRVWAEARLNEGATFHFTIG